MVFCPSLAVLLLLSIGGNRQAAHAKNGAEQMIAFFSQPRDGGLSHPALLPNWFTAWKRTLQLQLDDIFSMVAETRPGGAGMGGASDEAVVMPPFKITIVGDSTMMMQARGLTELLEQRKTTDGKSQCRNLSHETRNLDTRCVASSGGPQDVLHLSFVKVFGSCVDTRVSADFVYFGCGLHILPLIPNMSPEKDTLYSWLHYETLLEDAVLAYRARSNITGQAFMTTHAFSEEKMVNPYKTTIDHYRLGDAATLQNCREKVSMLNAKQGRVIGDDIELAEICTRGYFGEAGVVDLNRRAMIVMKRLGVAIVPGYDIVKGQLWATPSSDGRHYPSLIPVELNSLLTEISRNLREQRRVEWSVERGV